MNATIKNFEFKVDGKQKQGVLNLHSNGQWAVEYIADDLERRLTARPGVDDDLVNARIEIDGTIFSAQLDLLDYTEFGCLIGKIKSAFIWDQDLDIDIEVESANLEEQGWEIHQKNGERWPEKVRIHFRIQDGEIIQDYIDSNIDGQLVLVAEETTFDQSMKKHSLMDCVEAAAIKDITVEEY